MFADYDESTFECVNNLEESFGYYRPLMQEEDAQCAADEPKPRRGRPPKDPSAAMSAAQKAERRAMLVEAYTRIKSRKT